MLSGGLGVTTDSSGNVFVAAVISDNVFKISTPGTCSTIATPCAITEIIDAAGDGAGNILDLPQDITTDSSGNVYVAGFSSSNAFKITPGGTITEIIDSTGDGAGNPLSLVFGIETDSSGNVFVSGLGSDNAFKIEPEKKSCDALDKASEKGKGMKKGLEKAKANNKCS